jgi:transcriptional regulator with XRE-family HTH domain
MNVGKSISLFSANRGKKQAPQLFPIPQFVQLHGNQGLNLAPMDYKKEIGRRIRAAREEKSWTLADLERETGDVLSLKRINAYENGDRMPGPSEVVILSKALGVRPAYLMAIDDRQLPISKQEEALIRNWRTLPERERMDFFRSVEAQAYVHRDPVQDQVVEQHLPKPEKPATKGARTK